MINSSYVSEDDVAAVQQVLRANQLYGSTPAVAAMEAALAEYVGRRFCVATSSCTAALHLALLTVQPERVVAPAYTFSGTVHPIRYVGAAPEFVDVDHYGNMEWAGGACNIIVHSHGFPCELVGAGVVIEDACQALGARHADGALVGTRGDISCFSFSQGKPITGGQGGALLTDDPQVDKLVRSYRNYGEMGLTHLGTRTFIADKLGYNYSLDAMSAALIVSQLSRLEALTAQARHNARQLWVAVESMSNFWVPPFIEGANYNKVRLFTAGDRDFVVARLRQLGVPATLWGIRPVAEYPLYQAGIFPQARSLYDTSFIILDESHPLAYQDAQTMTFLVKQLRRLDWELESGLLE